MTFTPMQEIKQRLIELGVPPERIVGCTEAQIAEIMQAQGVSHLPEIYLDFLRVMGVRGGIFLWDGDWLYPALLESKKQALEELEEQNSPLKLPEDAFVFYCSNQRYVFDFFDTQHLAEKTGYIEYFAGKTAFIHHESYLDYWNAALQQYEPFIKQFSSARRKR